MTTTIGPCKNHLHIAECKTDFENCVSTEEMNDLLGRVQEIYTHAVKKGDHWHVFCDKETSIRREDGGFIREVVFDKTVTPLFFKKLYGALSQPQEMDEDTRKGLYDPNERGSCWISGWGEPNFSKRKEGDLKDGHTCFFENDQGISFYGNRRGKIESWEGEKNIAQVAAHSGRVACIRADSEGNPITASESGEITFWNSKAFASGDSFKITGGKLSCIEALGQEVISGHFNGLLQLWDRKGNLLELHKRYYVGPIFGMFAYPSKRSTSFVERNFRNYINEKGTHVNASSSSGGYAEFEEGRG